MFGSNQKFQEMVTEALLSNADCLLKIVSDPGNKLSELGKAEAAAWIKFCLSRENHEEQHNNSLQLLGYIRAMFHNGLISKEAMVHAMSVQGEMKTAGEIPDCCFPLYPVADDIP